MGFFKRKSSDTVVTIPAVDPTWLQWPTLAWGDRCEATGESYRQAAIWEACGSGADGPVRRLVTAQLAPEQTNQYDPNAVMVLIDGELVGYLPRRIAGDVQPYVLERTKALQVCSCRAFIGGGTRDKPMLGVWLALSNPVRPFPSDGSVPFLEDIWGRKLKSYAAVAGARAELLSRYGEGAKRRALLTVDESEGPSVSASVDGLTIGRVEVEDAERLIPLVREAVAAGFAPECTVKLYANKASVGAELRCVNTRP